MNKKHSSEKFEDKILGAENTIEVKQDAIRSSDGFLQYLREIQKFPLLSAAEEYEYGMRFKKTGDKEAAKMLTKLGGLK